MDSRVIKNFGTCVIERRVDGEVEESREGGEGIM